MVSFDLCINRRTNVVLCSRGTCQWSLHDSALQAASVDTAGIQQRTLLCLWVLLQTFTAPLLSTHNAATISRLLTASEAAPAVNLLAVAAGPLA
jgi:hypothetical protein